jgi:uncharacterized protein (DUF342 family)
MGVPAEEEQEQLLAEEAEVRDLDGYAYAYTDTKKGPCLVVMAPQGDGIPADYETVERELKKMSFEGVHWDRVKKAVEEATGKPIHLTGDEESAEDKPETEEAPLIVDKSQYVFITVSEDLVSAKLTIVPPDDKRIELTMEDVQKVITDAGITFGIDEEKMAEVEDVIAQIQSGDWIDPVEIEVAHGIEPQHGQDAQYEFFIDQQKPEEKSKPGMTEDGRVDYFAVQEVASTKRGQMVARRFPPTMGVPGKSIRGEEIPARDGTEGEWKIGRGVEHALGNENILVASVDGQVKTENNLLEVLALYEIPGDVDLSTGSIDFIGAVIIHGNVQPGFKVKAGEDILIEGVVDDAEIQTPGKVTVKGGVLGQGGKAKIVADGDITGMYFQNAVLETKATLTSAQYIRDCKVVANVVKAMGKRGQIVGGEVAAETEINAQSIGSSQTGSHTTLVVGESAAKRNEMAALTEEVKKMEEELEKTKKGMQVLKMQQEKGELPIEKKTLMNNLTRQNFKLLNDIKAPQERLHHMLAEEEEARKTRSAKISVLGTLYPGVKVKIRNAQKTINEELRYCTLQEKGADIKVGPYK